MVATFPVTIFQSILDFINATKPGNAAIKSIKAVVDTKNQNKVL